ncbi:MAG: choice-of-anchor V domain-containing protein, partial [Acidobacteriota bacterium]
MRTRLLPLGALVLAHLAPVTALANSTGLVGYSGKAGATCSTCHQGATVLLQTQFTGPAFLKPGATGSYTFILGYYFQSQNAGLGVAAQAGTLAVDPGEPTTKLVNQELVHSQPKSLSGPGIAGYSWKFSWTAPSAAGSYTLFGAGIASNNNKLSTGDANGKATFVVTVG